MIEIINIEKFPITLAQLIKFCGIAINGAEAKEIVRSKIVFLNDQICDIPGKKLQPEDKIVIETEQGCLEFLLKQS